jgi:hypothetical protein
MTLEEIATVVQILLAFQSGSYDYPHRTIEDGRIVSVIPLTFARARVCIGRDMTGYDNGW